MNQYIALSCVALAATHLSAQEFAVKQLDDSPRHHEWANVESNGRTVRCFIVFPEQPGDTPAVMVIHENRGLTPWVRSLADQIAAAGYLAIAPDLLSDFNETYRRSADFPTEDDARNALYELNPDQVLADLLAVERHIATAPSSNGKVAVAGFCWGGAQAFRLANASSGLSAVLVFYGTGPTDETGVASIAAPVHGFYAENDQRINTTIPRTESVMRERGKAFDYAIYEGAGHAFMRSGDDPAGSPANKKARDDAWERMLKILSRLQ